MMVVWLAPFSNVQTMQTVQIQTSSEEKSFIIIHVSCCRANEYFDDSINSPFTRYKIVISDSEGSVVSDIYWRAGEQSILWNVHSRPAATGPAQHMA